MTKKQLLEQIADLKEDTSLYRDIISKLVNDCIQIKPAPKGKVKARIVIFTEPITVNKLVIDSYITVFAGLDPKLTVAKECMFTGKNNKS